MRVYTCSEGGDGAWQTTETLSVVESDRGANNKSDTRSSSNVLGKLGLRSTL